MKNLKNPSMLLATIGFATFLSTGAMAGIDKLDNMKDGSRVTIQGTVDTIENEREFTLRDDTGSINVDIESNQSVVLKPGDSVTVTGRVSKNVLGTDLNASKVSVSKNMVKAVGDAIEANTSVSLEGADSYDINNLPNEGLVKVSGTVTDVDNEKEFTVMDNTGSINVDIESSQAAALSEGAEVTVIGYIDNGLFSKDIKAQKVMVTANAMPAR